MTIEELQERTIRQEKALALATVGERVLEVILSSESIEFCKGCNAALDIILKEVEALHGVS